MNIDAPMMQDFIENHQSIAYDNFVATMNLDGDPMDLLIKTLEAEKVTRIFKGTDLFLVGDIIADFVVDTDNGKYTLRIRKRVEQDHAEISIINGFNYKIINKYILAVKVVPDDGTDEDQP